jgi:hypothetical protein
MHLVSLAAVLVLLGASEALAQAGMQIAIVTDSGGNLVGQLAGNGMAVDVQGVNQVNLLPGTVAVPPPAPTPPPAAPAG